MARYYFDIINGEGSLRDDEGLDLSSTDAVRAEVAKIALKMARDEIEDRQAMAVTVNVRDDRDFRIYSGRLSFSTEWFDPELPVADLSLQRDRS